MVVKDFRKVYKSNSIYPRPRFDSGHTNRKREKKERKKREKAEDEDDKRYVFNKTLKHSFIDRVG